MESVLPTQSGEKLAAFGSPHAVKILRVASTSHVNAVAGAIAGIIRERQKAEIQAVGARAVNQTVKAIAIARCYLLEENVKIMFFPGFIVLPINNEMRTAIHFTVEVCKNG